MASDLRKQDTARLTCTNRALSGQTGWPAPVVQTGAGLAQIGAAPMSQRTRTVDLAEVATPSQHLGRTAVWTDCNGREHVGVLEPDPFGGAWPVVSFGDGTHGRNESVVEVVEDGPPCPAKDGGYLCTLPEGHAGDHAAEGVEGQPPLHTWRGMSPLPGLATLRGGL